MPSFMKTPSRTYDVSVVCSCRCLAISLPGSILSTITAGPKDWSLFKTWIVTVPLVLGNGAGTAWTFEVSTVFVKVIALTSHLSWSLSPQPEQLRRGLPPPPLRPLHTHGPLLVVAQVRGFLRAAWPREGGKWRCHARGARDSPRSGPSCPPGAAAAPARHATRPPRRRQTLPVPATSRSRLPQRCSLTWFG